MGIKTKRVAYIGMEPIDLSSVKQNYISICIVCGERADIFYVNAEKEVVGCDNCIEPKDASEIKISDYYEGG